MFECIVNYNNSGKFIRGFGFTIVILETVRNSVTKDGKWAKTGGGKISIVSRELKME